MPLSSPRSHFPALDRRHNGQQVAYFDGPGGTQVPRQVVDAMADYLLHHNANTHWVYPTSVETDTMILQARAQMADFLNASPREVSFANNMTTGTFHLARALGRQWGPGDEVVVTDLDHHANVAPWRALERERGITVKRVEVDPSKGELVWDSLKAALGPRTRLLAIGAGSNALGTVTDVTEATRLAHAVGAQVFVDAVHYAPHSLVDVRAMNCDFLGCSSYKFYGPHAGIIFGKESLLGALEVPKLEPAPDNAPDRMETGTQNHEGIVGAGAAVEFLASFGTGTTRREKLVSAFEGFRRDEMSLFHRLWDGLGSIAGVTRYGPGPDRPRTPTISFTVDGATSEQVARALVEKGIFVSNGDFYATTIVRRLGHGDTGLVRAGISIYTSEEEIDRLIDAVREVAQQ